MTRGHFLAAGFWLAAASLSFFIEKETRQASFSFDIDNSLSRILGSAKEGVGDVLFLQADAYYHGGVIDKFSEEGNALRTAGAVAEDKDHEKEAAPSDWIARINHEVTSHVHRHMQLEETRELLPFFALSTMLDPHNIEAILTTAFWLDKAFGKTDEAIRVLQKGIEANPDSWELESGLANLCLLRKKDAASGERHYLEAIRKSKGREMERYEKLDTYYFLGESYFLEGKKSESLAAYRQALKYLEKNKPTAIERTLQEKIKSLSVIARSAKRDEAI